MNNFFFSLSMLHFVYVCLSISLILSVSLSLSPSLFYHSSFSLSHSLSLSLFLSLSIFFLQSLSKREYCQLLLLNSIILVKYISNLCLKNRWHYSSIFRPKVTKATSSKCYILIFILFISIDFCIHVCLHRSYLIIRICLFLWVKK